LTIELASGFTACQAVQQRVIYSLYARLANIELDFEAQVCLKGQRFKHPENPIPWPHADVQGFVPI